MVDLKLHFPDKFFEGETRNGFYVSSEVKKVWAVELDLFNEFDRVCKKYDIKYCADGGTLLGAVRHHGFIPWDDDLDIAMLRSEFEKLNKIALSEFKAPYFWQTEETDPGSARGHAQLRNSNTTAILTGEYKNKRNNNFNQGIFIDIFPFDTVIDEQEKLIDQDEKRLILKDEYTKILDFINYFYIKPMIDENGKIHTGLKKLFWHFKYMLSHKSYSEVYREFISEITKYDNINSSKYVADLCMNIPLKRIRRFREDFYNLKEVDFEFLKIPIFENYDRNLKILYGDNYMIPIQAKSEHGNVILDTERSYTWYLSKRK